MKNEKKGQKILLLVLDRVSQKVLHYKKWQMIKAVDKNKKVR